MLYVVCLIKLYRMLNCAIDLPKIIGNFEHRQEYISRIPLQLSKTILPNIHFHQPRPRPSSFTVFTFFNMISQQQGQNCPETALIAKCPIIAFSNRIICNLTANLNRYRYNKLIYSINLLFLFVYTPRKSGFIHCTG